MLPPACIYVFLAVTVLLLQMDPLCTNPDPGLWGLNSFYCLRAVFSTDPPTHSHILMPRLPSLPHSAAEIFLQA